jgi:hypothetical protein
MGPAGGRKVRLQTLKSIMRKPRQAATDWALNEPGHSGSRVLTSQRARKPPSAKVLVAFWEVAPPFDKPASATSKIELRHTALGGALAVAPSLAGKFVGFLAGLSRKSIHHLRDFIDNL